MSSILPKSIRKLIEELSRLPGIGPKSAQRLTFYLLKSKDLDRDQLSDAVGNLTTGLTFCKQCHNLAEHELCQICSDKTRNQNQICVVEEPLDVVSLEQGRSHRGTYHVLGGVISPIDGIGPAELRISELIDRIKKFDDAEIEVIMATNPSLEGESTALYIARQIKIFPNVKITRIAHGLPIGGDIEYADELTIAKALEGRRDYSAK
ncbi:MAG: recombination mediator RecR [bacterium]|nr:recombination mediator RecR [bacterium]